MYLRSTLSLETKDGIHAGFSFLKGVAVAISKCHNLHDDLYLHAQCADKTLRTYWVPNTFLFQSAS